MITIIAGTNRINSNSELVAGHLADLLKGAEMDCQVLLLKDLPGDFISTDMYGLRTPEFQEIADKYIIPVEHFIFVIPEYNGGFPGILKTFIDALSPKWLHHKKAQLVGLSTGAAGSLRGMDQFSNVLNYLKVLVHYHKPKLSSFASLLSEEQQIINERAVSELNLTVEEAKSF